MESKSKESNVFVKVRQPPMKKPDVSTALIVFGDVARFEK